MRYMIVDLGGASRVAFTSLSRLRDWAHALNEQDPVRLGDLLIERYDDHGHKVGESEWADDFLSDLGESDALMGSQDLTTANVVVLYADRPIRSRSFSSSLPHLETSSGRAVSSWVGFSHPREAATGTRDPAPEERVAG